MAAPLSVEVVLAAAGIALVMIGAVAALLSGNAIKRLGGLVVSGFGAAALLTALGGGSAPVIASVAVLLVYAVLGVTIAVRLQETYGSIEALEIDAADADSDVQERSQ